MVPIPATEKHAQRKAITVEHLCHRYFADAEAGRLLVHGGQPKKPLTLVTDQNHLIPLLGSLPVAAVTRQDVEPCIHAIAEGHSRSTRVPGGRGAAHRTIGLLGAIFSYAIEQRLRDDNPARGVRRFAEGKRTRRLIDDEYGAFGVALRALDLPETKSGRSLRPLSRAARDVLQAQARSATNGLIFSAAHAGRSLPSSSFTRQVRSVVTRAGLTAEISAHVLRHSFASLAADLGYSDATSGALIGHRGQSVTYRYMHLADAPLLAAADAVAEATVQRMGDARQTGVVVPSRSGTVGPQR